MGFFILLMIASPLIGSISNGLILRTKEVKRAGVIATAAAGGSFVCAVILYLTLIGTGHPIEISFRWFQVGDIPVHWGYRFDALTAMMALMVTGIGTAIHLYSIGYMSEEPTPYRYF